MIFAGILLILLSWLSTIESVKYLGDFPYDYEVTEKVVKAGDYEIREKVIKFTDNKNRNQTLKPVVVMGSESILVEVNPNTFWRLPNPKSELIAVKDELEEIFNVADPKHFQNTSTGCSHGCNGWDDRELAEHETDDEKETQTKDKRLKEPYFNNETKKEARDIIQEKIISLVGQEITGKKATVTWYKRTPKKRKPRISVDETLAESAGDALFTKLKEWNFGKNIKIKFKLKVQASFNIFELVENTEGKENDSTNSERRYRFILKLY